LIIHDPDAARQERLIALLGASAEPGCGRAARPARVCNATPRGMSAGDPLPLDPALMRAGVFVGDVIAGHVLTPLLAAAQAAGCKTADGDQMVAAVQTIMLDFMLGV
jgi:shikimate dehydrogenase